MKYYNMVSNMDKMKQVHEDFSCKQRGDANEEAIGSCFREYIVNDNIKIYVATNLGFGNCSYFTLKLQYKGIDILPYSTVLNCYNEDTRDVLKYLRKYSPQSESWNLAMDFIKDVEKLEAMGEERFCEKFLKNEIDSMLDGLAKAVEDPEAYMNEKESSKFEAYPYEMSVAFMTGKIMNALMVLHNLQSLSAVYPYGQEAIKKIKELATAVLPKIDECISRIIYQLNQLRVAGASNNKCSVNESEKLNEETKTRLDFLDVLTDCIDMVEIMCGNNR